MQEIGYGDSPVSTEPEIAKAPVKTQLAIRPKSILIPPPSTSMSNNARPSKISSKEAQDRRQQVTKSIIYAPEDLEKLKNPENV